MATSRDIVNVCEEALRCKRKGNASVTINGITIPDLCDGSTGWCQRTAKLILMATTGQAMPGAACCAYATNLNLWAYHVDGHRHGVVEVVPNVEAGGRPDMALPGDYLYFRGGGFHSRKARANGACDNRVGHVGIWLGDGRMFQHTSRSGLAVTDEGPTTSQLARFCGAYRLLPLAEEHEPVKAVEPGTFLWDEKAQEFRRIGEFLNVGGAGFAPVRAICEACALSVEYQPGRVELTRAD